MTKSVFSNITQPHERGLNMSAELIKSIQAIKTRIEHIIEAIPAKEHAFAAALTSTLQSMMYAPPEMISTHADRADAIIEENLPRIQDCYKPWQTEVYARWSGKK